MASASSIGTATGTAGSQVLTASESTLFNGNGFGAAEVVVSVPSDSAAGVLVSVDPLHQAREFMLLPAGTSQTFAAGGGGLITKITAKADGADADVSWGIVRRYPGRS